MLQQQVHLDCCDKTWLTLYYIVNEFEVRQVQKSDGIHIPSLTGLPFCKLLFF